VTEGRNKPYVRYKAGSSNQNVLLLQRLRNGLVLADVCFETDLQAEVTSKTCGR
jgi:hypothetical protein